MRKVMTIVGTRPELIKMSRVISELDLYTNHILVHSGQNYDYELNQVFFNDLGIRKPDFFLEAAGENAAQTIAKVIERSDVLMRTEKPDAVLLYGDTNTCLAVIAAERLKIPTFHMEAGNRCFDQRVTEELNRKVIDHLSDINLVLTEHARDYLVAEGIRPHTIIKTGSHMEEVLDHFMPQIKKSLILESLGLYAEKYFIVSIPREENVDNPENLTLLIESIKALADTWGFPVVVSTHPRTRARLESLGCDLNHPLIRFLKPFGFFDYIKLQMESFCVVSDSGTIFEESSLLNLPAVTVRNAHERPEGMDEGILIMSSLDSVSLLDSVRVITGQFKRGVRVMRAVKDYSGGPVSKQVLRVVLSYTDYVNRTVWHKH